MFGIFLFLVSNTAYAESEKVIRTPEYKIIFVTDNFVRVIGLREDEIIQEKDATNRGWFIGFGEALSKGKARLFSMGYHIISETPVNYVRCTPQTMTGYGSVTREIQAVVSKR